ncbi:MAG: DUF1501 domain-containing protein [Bacteroidota bacterium]
MNRRNFLQTILPMGLAPIALGGIPLSAMADPLLNQSFSCGDIGDRVLVLVQLAGGNDGINMLLPVDQYATYKNLRPTIAINDTGSRKYTNIDTTLALNQQVGIQPDMMALKDLYDDGKVNLVLDVNYANNNKSHFKGTDIWMAGKDSTSGNGNLGSGWFGRYLDHRYPNYPNAYPNPSMPDPLGIQLGSNTMALGFYRNSGIPTGMSLKGDPNNFYNLVSGVGGPLPATVPNSHYGQELNYLMQVQSNTSTYAARLDTVYNAGQNLVTYPTTHYQTGVPNYWNNLAPQLKVVARLISGGCKTKVYLVRLSGFDTHTQQTLTNDPSMGSHSSLMYHLSQSLKAFQDDLKALGVEDKVMTVTFSEFGRTITENGSRGTDHGTSAPMVVMGKGVTPGVTGINPDLSMINRNNLTSYQFDYRRIFTTLLQDWLGAGGAALTGAELSAFETQKMDLVNTNYVDPVTSQTISYKAPPSCYIGAFPVEFAGFDANMQRDFTVLCEWETASETNNELFSVERSPDGLIFESVGEVPGQGNSSTLEYYSFVDPKPIEGNSFYRIKQVDFDGRFSYSDIREVRLDQDMGISLETTFFPNPAPDMLYVKCESSGASEGELRLVQTSGAEVYRKDIRLTAGQNQFEVPVNQLPPAIYYAEIGIRHKNVRHRAGWGKVVVRR